MNSNNCANGIKSHKTHIINPDIRDIFLEEYSCVIFGATIIVKTEPIEKITKR